MRKNPTPAEKKLWQDLIRFLPDRWIRQRVIGHYIVDFYCAALKLVVEVDGASHFAPEGQAHDKERTAFLNSLNLKVLRFTNRQVFAEMDSIKRTLEEHFSNLEGLEENFDRLQGKGHLFV